MNKTLNKSPLTHKNLYDNLNTQPDTPSGAKTIVRKSRSNNRTPASFDTTMAEITRPMPAHSRLFSKFIHVRFVEKLSDIVGATVLRPNALLFGASLSFTLTLVLYILARNLGYQLSGFESIGAFILGWLIGLSYDFIRLMITGKH